MKTPGLFIGCALLFWGWQTGFWWAALIFIPVIEGARFVRSKWDFSSSDFNKVIDLSTVLLAGTIVVALTLKPAKANIILLNWLPIIFFPVITAQEYSHKGRIAVKSFMLASRRKTKISFQAYGDVDVSYMYAFLCIISAGTANSRQFLFYFAILVFFGWGVWAVRPKRYLPVLFSVFLVLAGVLGYFSYSSVDYTRKKLSYMAMRYYIHSRYRNPFKTSTSLGDMGQMKLSDRIISRVRYDGARPGKRYLLHEATYTKFISSNWYSRPLLNDISPEKNDTTWHLRPYEKDHKFMTFYMRLGSRRKVLKIPSGAFRIDEMRAGLCKTNDLGAVVVEKGPLLIKGRVSYNPDKFNELAPQDRDLVVAKAEAKTIERIAEKLNLKGMSNAEAVEAVKKYFAINFSYTLDLSGKGMLETPLQNFLLNTKEGHCEFFATATTLLLRQAGIPARYSTGFIAHEYSKLNDMMVVRERDAHSWVKYYVNGKWQTLDTTPPVFILADKQASGSSELKDLLSYIWFKLLQLRYETGTKLLEKYGLWLVVPLAVFLFYRLRTSRNIKKIRKSGPKGETKAAKRMNFKFYRIEAALLKKGFKREPYETYAVWFHRIEKSLVLLLDAQKLHQVLMLHNKIRFGRYGLDDTEGKLMDTRMDELLVALDGK